MMIGPPVGPYMPALALILKEHLRPRNQTSVRFGVELLDQVPSFREPQTNPYLPTTLMLSKELQAWRDIDFPIAPKPPFTDEGRGATEFGQYKPTTAMLSKESARKNA